MSKPLIPRGPATRDVVCHDICEHVLHVLSSNPNYEIARNQLRNCLRTGDLSMLGYWGKERVRDRPATEGLLRRRGEGLK
jgi:hypothetical protein